MLKVEFILFCLIIPQAEIGLMMGLDSLVLRRLS